MPGTSTYSYAKYLRERNTEEKKKTFSSMASERECVAVLR